MNVTISMNCVTTGRMVKETISATQMNRLRLDFSRKRKRKSEKRGIIVHTTLFICPPTLFVVAKHRVFMARTYLYLGQARVPTMFRGNESYVLISPTIIVVRSTLHVSVGVLPTTIDRLTTRQGVTIPRKVQRSRFHNVRAVLFIIVTNSKLFLYTTFNQDSTFRRFLQIFRILPRAINVRIGIRSFRLSIVMRIRIVSHLRTILPSKATTFLGPFTIAMGHYERKEGVPTIIKDVIMIMARTRQVLFIRLVIRQRRNNRILYVCPQQGIKLLPPYFFRGNFLCSLLVVFIPTIRSGGRAPRVRSTLTMVRIRLVRLQPIVPMMGTDPIIRTRSFSLQLFNRGTCSNNRKYVMANAKIAGRFRQLSIIQFRLLRFQDVARLSSISMSFNYSTSRSVSQAFFYQCAKGLIRRIVSYSNFFRCTSNCNDRRNVSFCTYSKGVTLSRCLVRRLDIQGRPSDSRVDELSQLMSNIMSRQDSASGLIKDYYIRTRASIFDASNAICRNKIEGQGCRGVNVKGELILFIDRFSNCNLYQRSANAGRTT